MSKVQTINSDNKQKKIVWLLKLPPLNALHFAHLITLWYRFFPIFHPNYFCQLLKINIHRVPNQLCVTSHQDSATCTLISSFCRAIWDSNPHILAIRSKSTREHSTPSNLNLNTNFHRGVLFEYRGRQRRLRFLLQLDN